MYLLFVDESGTPAKPGVEQPAFFVIAGVVIPEGRWHDLRQKIIGLKRRRRYRGELKWRFFAPSNSDKDNPMADWPKEDRDQMRRDVFDIIASSRSCKVLAVVSEAMGLYERPNVHNQADLYFETYKPITERFQYLLQDLQRDGGRNAYGLIIADHRGRGDDDSMRLRHERLVHEDGIYTSKYENLIEGLFFTPSHMSIGVQLADMVAGAIWRAIAKGDATHFETFRSAIRAHPTSAKIDGFGLVRVPKNNWKGPRLDE